MATVRTFNSMLNEYLTYDLLMEEVAKRSYFLENVEKDNNWRGGTLIVPFKGANASSYKYGGLTSDTDIAENEYVRGQVSGYKEIWGTMKWNARDLMEHGKVSEQSFLKNLPDQIEDFIEGMKEVVSVNLLTGDHFAKLTVDGTIAGVIVVDRPERFTLKQKVFVDDNNSVPSAAGYVQSIDINTKTITLDTTRAGGTDLDVSAYTVAQNARVYVDGAETAGTAFTSLKSQLLSATNGGSPSLFGQLKTAYPYLQAINHDGATITSSNFLDKIFDYWTAQKQLGKGTATDVVMSYKHLGTAMKSLELASGPYKNVNMKVNIYGWTEITVTGVKGTLKFVGVHEMDDDIIFFLDWKCMKLHSNQFFKKQQSPEGLSYFTQRNTSGYVYICDVSFYGELVVNKPTGCGIIYGINY